MEEKIKKIFKNNKITISDLQAKQFKEYYNYLIEENSKFNLTAITNFEDVVYKHFLDSVIFFERFEKNAKIIDVGTGAGFPGVPLKILRPDLNVILLDSLNKRIIFLNNLINILNLKNINAVHSRIEDFAHKNRGLFDYALSRAVAKINVLSEYLLPVLKIGGEMVLYKSQNINEETKEAKNAFKILGGELCEIKNIKINKFERNLVYIKKIKQTPIKYPRLKNLPKTHPII